MGLERVRTQTSQGQQKSICVLVPFASGECVNSPGMWHQFPVGDGKGNALSDPSMHLHGDMSYLRGSKEMGEEACNLKSSSHSGHVLSEHYSQG